MILSYPGIVYLFLFTVQFAVLEALRDRHYIEEGATIDHNIGWLIRFVYFASMGVMGIPLFFLFYIIFDPLLNLLRGKDFFYTGDPEDPHGSHWDRIVRKAPITFFIVEIILFVSTFYYTFVE